MPVKRDHAIRYRIENLGTAKRQRGGRLHGSRMSDLHFTAMQPFYFADRRARTSAGGNGQAFAPDLPRNFATPFKSDDIPMDDHPILRERCDFENRSLVSGFQ